MRFYAIMLTWLLLAQPVWALSCLTPDIARDYAQVAQSAETYIVVRGDLVFDESKLPNRVDERASRQRDSMDIPAWLVGKSLTKDGFTRAFERDVILRVSCLGPWCGGAVKGPHLAFLRQENLDWVMQASPCPGLTYANPTPLQERTVMACFQGDTCAEP